jgi:hypothetical protein
MAAGWYGYGRTPSDWAFGVNIDGVTPELVPGAVLTAWNAETGGTQLDMSLDGGATTVASITASDGTDGLVPGTVDQHWVQQTTYWIDGNAGAGPRTLMTTSDAADIAVTALNTASNQADTINNNSAILAYVQLVCIAVAGVYPPRPGVAGDRMVAWYGSSPPPVGGTDGAVDGDEWHRTAA